MPSFMMRDSRISSDLIQAAEKDPTVTHRTVETWKEYWLTLRSDELRKKT